MIKRDQVPFVKAEQTSNSTIKRNNSNVIVNNSSSIPVTSVTEPTFHSINQSLLPQPIQSMVPNQTPQTSQANQGNPQPTIIRTARPQPSQQRKIHIDRNQILQFIRNGNIRFVRPTAQQQQVIGSITGNIPQSSIQIQPQLLFNPIRINGLLTNPQNVTNLPYINLGQQTTQNHSGENENIVGKTNPIHDDVVANNSTIGENVQVGSVKISQTVPTKTVPKILKEEAVSTKQPFLLPQQETISSEQNLQSLAPIISSKESNCVPMVPLKCAPYYSHKLDKQQVKIIQDAKNKLITKYSKFLSSFVQLQTSDKPNCTIYRDIVEFLFNISCTPADWEQRLMFYQNFLQRLTVKLIAKAQLKTKLINQSQQPPSNEQNQSTTNDNGPLMKRLKTDHFAESFHKLRETIFHTYSNVKYKNWSQFASRNRETFGIPLAILDKKNFLNEADYISLNDSFNAFTSSLQLQIELKAFETQFAYHTYEGNEYHPNDPIHIPIAIWVSVRMNIDCHQYPQLPPAKLINSYEYPKQPAILLLDDKEWSNNQLSTIQMVRSSLIGSSLSNGNFISGNVCQLLEQLHRAIIFLNCD
ncbi:hypothetical protein RDWZM_005251 [Blomia tropicalis]|uniref:Uncharacterized protein n=1 Tax=Blomia tropicalis TaxID=40697 RepID=A0A9Q0M5N2_BLOTA|nr:hypothetical protein RDWZM_005251 [Blomia tropicalis]